MSFENDIAMIKRLDAFYTKHEIAHKCMHETNLIAYKLVGDAPFYIEPSAGDGVFYDLLPYNSRIGFDIEPRHKDVIACDFLASNYTPPKHKSRVIIIGNPPFGLRGNLAVAFMKKAFVIADTVAFIVPVIFRKYFIHKQLPKELRWIYSLGLPRNAFRTCNKANYSVHTEFQIWTRIASDHKNQRLFISPPITHKDFFLYQYNNTKEALKVFENAFDFAVPCQGYQDYTRRERSVEKCEKNKQWILFKANTKAVLDRLYNIDFETLAMKHTTMTPGFRKGDVIHEYALHYDPDH